MSMASSEEQFGQILALLRKNLKGIQELRSSMTEIRALRTDINIWKPLVDNRVSELEHAVMDLDERMEQALGTLLPQAQPVDSSTATLSGYVTIAQPPPTTAPGDLSASASLKVPGSAHLEPTPPRASSGSKDHGEENHHRGTGFGVVYTTTPIPAPVTGTPISFIPTLCNLDRLVMHLVA